MLIFHFYISPYDNGALPRSTEEAIALHNVSMLKI